MNRRLLLIVVSVICVFSTQAQNNRDIYLNMDASQHERILDLLSKLTVEEKISLLRATSPGIPRLNIIMGMRPFMEFCVRETLLYFRKPSDWLRCGIHNYCMKYQR